ncbi:hypothetical protein CCAX7_43380 [Capsulimonas corticalis]|uniref:RNase NYN domain-containing protein n=1 Tax=Capsulimonas corticalis TaxID=2219043 RepID=A0A9N7L6J0_9BACT|nr:hypothetical protein CCAX7_43380 [Capsulimonas corticalis]
MSPEPISGDAPAQETAELAPEPLTFDEAYALLAAFKAPPVISLLQEKDYLLLRATVFSGFRMNHQGLGNPVVRRRLAEEAARNGAFAQRLRDLSESDDSLKPAPSASKPEKVSEPDDVKRREEELHQERQKRKRDRDEAREQIAALKERVREAERREYEAGAALRAAEAERDTLAQTAEKHSLRIARLERQTARLTNERGQLLKSLAGHAPGSRGAANHSSKARTIHTASKDDVWEEAVRHLIDKNKHDLALSLANDVLRADPNNLAALDIVARVMEASGDPRAASISARALVTASLGRGDIRAATDAMVKLLLIDPQTPEAEKVSRAFVASIRTDDREIIKHAGAAFARLRKLNGQAYARLQQQIRKQLPAALADTLDPAPGALGPDDVLPLPGFFPYPLTAAAILSAIDRGDLPIVASVRKSLAHCETSDPALHSRLIAALELAAEGDRSYLGPLQKKPLGSVVVDASNAAWFDQESLTAGRARLKPILELRRALRGRGYFPVHLMGDAPLPYTIDDPDELRLMIAREEITIVDSGTDADVVLLREAKRLRAPLVTNDYMADWDPQGEVTKLRFDLPPHGGALFWT